MGLLGRGRGRGRGAVARGRAATTWVASGLAPTTPVLPRGRGRGGPRGRAAMMAARTLDRRPKSLEVTGFDKEEKDEVDLHLMVIIMYFLETFNNLHSIMLTVFELWCLETKFVLQ